MPLDVMSNNPIPVCSKTTSISEPPVVPSALSCMKWKRRLCKPRVNPALAVLVNARLLPRSAAASSTKVPNAACAYTSGATARLANSCSLCLVMNPVSTSPAINAGFWHTRLRNSILILGPTIS